MKKIFKVGDWCFCEYKLQQVTRIAKELCALGNTIVTEVTDGNFILSSSNITNRCFHITYATKQISEVFQTWNNKFHSSGFNGLNYPMLNSKLINEWATMCASDDDILIKELYDYIDEFGQNVMVEIKKMKELSVDGVRLLR